MVRLRHVACAVIALLAISSAGCRRKHPRYPDPPPGGPPGADPGAPPPDPGGPPGPPPAPPGPPVVGPPQAGPPPGGPTAPPPGQERVLNVTGAAHKLARLTTDPIDEVAPALSPSGGLLLFEARASAGGAVVRQTLIAVDPHGGGNRTVYSPANARSYAAAWLPDGSFLFTSNATGRPLVVHSLAAVPNAAIAPVIGGDAAPDVGHPSASPDGRRVVFEATIQGKPQIAIVNLDGAHLRALGDGHRPAWSPDGKRIVFTRTVNDYSQLMVIGADGGSAAQITSDQSDHDDPAWAPSGKAIVFNSNRGYGRQAGAWNLFAIKPDGSGLIQVTDGNADSGEPDWGNDGWIYFDSNQGGSYDIWKLRPAGELEALGNQR